VQLYTGLPLI